ncbi:MAG: gamma-glutamyltransferase family protein [Spirochaetaceae bacterium]|nr:MAG: gamma-glutamyltransferase family protein [Spirochaetaceae bacterium]
MRDMQKNRSIFATYTRNSRSTERSKRIFRAFGTFFVTAFCVMLVLSCNRGIDRADGVYRGYADEVNEYGWTAALELSLRDGTVVDAYLDMIGNQGELLRHELYAQQAIEAEYGDPIISVLDRLTEAIVATNGGTGSVSSSIPGLTEQFRSLSTALLSRAETGDTTPVLVETGAGGSPAPADLLEASFSPDARTDLRRAVRGGTADPGVYAGGFAAVASHYAAVDAAMDILEAGGTAADAVFTMATMISVVEPFLSHALGGGSWILYFDAIDGNVHAIDGVGPVPMAATPEFFQENDRHRTNGIHRSNVPGAWAGYIALLEEFGSLPLDDLLAPAIDTARNGFTVTSQMMNWLPSRSSFISTLPDSAEVFLPGGELPEVGDTLVNENLSRTFEGLADAYRSARIRGERTALRSSLDYFYRGPVAEEIVRFSNENGGLFALTDFSEFTDFGLVDPISIDYRGLQVFQAPPNSQGITQLQALRILEGFDFSEREALDADSIHMMAEAIKLAFADRNRYVADPAFVDVPVDLLLGDEHIRAQRDMISMTASLEHPIDDVLGIAPASGTNTSTFHVVDRYGNVAAITSSIGASFMIAGETGITFNERLSFMESDPDDINRIEPGKKVRHSAGPYLVLREGAPYIAGGNTGADFQPQGQLQQFMHIVEFGMHPQDAVDMPRFQPQAFAATNFPFAAQTRLALEQDRFPQEVWDSLEARGQRVEWAGYFGRQNVIVVEDHASGDILTGAESREEDARGRVGRP